MSRNDLFFLIACAIAVTVVSGSPSPLTQPSSLTIASLIAPLAADGVVGDPAVYQQSAEHQ